MITQCFEEYKLKNLFLKNSFKLSDQSKSFLLFFSQLIWSVFSCLTLDGKSEWNMFVFYLILP